MRAWLRNFLAISDMNRTDDNISGAVTQLLLKEPFYAHLLGNLSREISIRTPTIGLEKTHGGYNLIVNPEYFDQFLPTICHANCYTKALQACRERKEINGKLWGGIFAAFAIGCFLMTVHIVHILLLILPVF